MPVTSNTTSPSANNTTNLQPVLIQVPVTTTISNRTQVNEAWDNTPQVGVAQNPQAPDNRSFGVALTTSQQQAIQQFLTNTQQPFPDDNPMFWDNITVGNFKFTGIVEVRAKKEILLDSKALKRAGQDGQPIISKGYKNSDVRITFKCWMPDHFNFYYALGGYWNPSNRNVGVQTQRNAVQITHPTLNGLGLSGFYVIKSMSSMERDNSIFGLYRFEMELMEWRQLSNTNTTTRSRGNTTAPNTVAGVPGSAHNRQPIAPSLANIDIFALINNPGGG